MVKGYNNLKCISGTKVQIKTEKQTIVRKKENHPSAKEKRSKGIACYLNRKDADLSEICTK